MPGSAIRRPGGLRLGDATVVLLREGDGGVGRRRREQLGHERGHLKMSMQPVGYTAQSTATWLGPIMARPSCCTLIRSPPPYLEDTVSFLFVSPVLGDDANRRILRSPLAFPLETSRTHFFLPPKYFRACHHSIFPLENKLTKTRLSN